MVKIHRKVAKLLQVDNTKLSVVAYTDGSARPNPGDAGWGVHGYTFNNVERPKPVVVRTNTVSNLGYLNRADRLFKVCTPIDPLQYFDFAGSYSDRRTNNYAELNAIIYALEAFIDEDLGSILIYTDSEYALNGIYKNCALYEKSGWKRTNGDPIPNVELWKRMWSLIKQYHSKDVLMSFQWVKGHSGDLGNELADSLATLGMIHSRAGIEKIHHYIDDAKSYNATDIIRHPFINYNRIYYNSVADYNVEGHYFQANPGGGDFIVGHRNPDTGFSVVHLENSDPILEMIKSTQYLNSADNNAIMMMMLDQIYSRRVYPYLEKFDMQSMIKDTRNLNLNFIDGTPLTVEMNPTGLSLRALESFNVLGELMEDFVTYNESGYDSPDNIRQMQAHDITEVFFDIVEDKKGNTKYTLKKEYGNGFKDMTIDLDVTVDGITQEMSIPYVLGTDLMPRNNLKRLEVDKPRINVITWKESEGSIRYATIVQVSDSATNNAIGIWSNYFADRIFLKKKS